MMHIPSAKVVYTALANGLEPALDQLDLVPVAGPPYPAWRLVRDNGQTVFLSLQIDAKAVDQFAGGGFRVELEHSTQRAPALGINGRALFFQLMTAEELKLLLFTQNRIIEALPVPPQGHIDLYPEGPIRQQYLEYFCHQQAFDAVRSWLRFTSEVDVQDWAHILVPLIEPLVRRAEIYLSPERRALGKGYLLPASEATEGFVRTEDC